MAQDYPKVLMELLFVIKEKAVWYLFYERDDLGIWLATSKDLKVDQCTG